MVRSRFSADFFSQSAELVARHLLGATLVRRWADGAETRCRIVETEAYTGREDLASHGRRHPTPRNRPMYGQPGLVYIYKSRGIHWMFNVVAEPEDHPAAVLIRAAEPLTGLDRLAARRPGRPPEEWTSGPGRLCQALDIDNSHQQIDISFPERGLWMEPGERVPDDRVSRGPRVGMGKTPEPWYSLERRWWVTGNRFVSKYR